MERKKYTPKEKMQIVLEGLRGADAVAEVCRRRGLSPSQYYQWRDRLLSGAEQIYANKKNRPNHKEQRLQEQLRRLRAVIAEITAENLELKKTLGD